MVARSVRLALALFALGPVAAAQATKPGHWDPVTSANGVNIDQIATVRTPDGRVHVIWHHHTTPSTDSLVQTVLAPNGSVGGPQEIASGWAGVGDSVILRDSAGRLLVFSPATRSSSAIDPLNSIEQWTSPGGGGAWALTPSPVVTGAGFSDPLGGALGPDRTTPFIAWTTTDGVFVHRGSDPSTTSTNLEQAAGFACCGYDPGVALDSSSGAVIVAWYALVNQGNAVYARALNPATGAPTGATLSMPGTRNAVTPDQRIGLTGRPGKSGVYAAYNGGGASQNKVLVWRVGAASASTLATRHSTELRDPAIAATPDGRLWVAWSASGRIWARRSNPAANKWGAETSIPVRHGTGTVYKVALNASAGPLDVFGAFAPSAGSGVQTWHSQILPALTLTVSPKKLAVAKGKHVNAELTVTDAGAPVKGARVRLGAGSANTNPTGAVKLTLGPIAHTTSFTLRVTKSGYTAASIRIRVRLK
jgi:hypothetical protein